MKLVIFGLSISSAWGNGHATLWRGLCHSLAGQGHTVTFFERDTPYYAPHRDYTVIPGGRLYLYQDWYEVEALARQELREAEVGMVTSYCPDAVPACEAVWDQNSLVRCFYDLDAPVTLDRLSRGEAVDYVHPRGWADFDVVFSYTGGRTLPELQRQLGARRVVPLYGSVDPSVHAPAPPSPDYRADLSYLGTYAADRQPALEKLLLAPARLLPKRRFLIGGAMYPSDFPWTNNLYFKAHVPPQDHQVFYSSSRLTLNVTRQAMAAMGYCPSARLFEAAACGVPLLSDSWPGLEDFFTPGEEILLVEKTADVVAAISLTDAELHRLSRRARERALTEHTAEVRAREMVDALSAVSAAVPVTADEGRS